MEIENYIGEKGGKLRERNAFREARDEEIKGWVKRNVVISDALLADLIGYERTPQHRQLAQRHIERLAKQGHFQHVEQDKIHYAVSFEQSLRVRGAKAQLFRRNMESYRMATCDRIVTFDTILSGQALRAKFSKDKGRVIADGFSRLGQRGWCWEDESGWHTPKEMANQSLLYVEQARALKAIFGVTDLKVVWNLHNWKQVPSVVQELQSVENNGMFLVTHDSTFDPRHADKLRAMALFQCPKFPEPVKLLED